MRSLRLHAVRMGKQPEAAQATQTAPSDPSLRVSGSTLSLFIKASLLLLS